ncbi:oxytocin receptor-like [Diadema antillarum]|uniref:oxytocin receptor-like n=1 Tax=Diadema antillarum TaxID=105358 RepID=UPI003A83D794
MASTSFTNESLNNEESDSNLPLRAIFSAFGIFGILGNGVVFVVIVLTKDLHKSTNFLIANQSVIDLAASLFLLALQLLPGSLPVDRPLFAQLICALWVSWSPFWMSVAASGANLIVITSIALQLKRGPGQESEKMTRRERARRDVVKTVLVVCLAYIVCWAPNDLYGLYSVLGGNVSFDGVAYELTILIAFSNMWINPIIYSFRYHKFQAAIKRLLTGQEKNRSSTVVTDGYFNKEHRFSTCVRPIRDRSGESR